MNGCGNSGEYLEFPPPFILQVAVLFPFASRRTLTETHSVPGTMNFLMVTSIQQMGYSPIKTSATSSARVSINLRGLSSARARTRWVTKK